jgi:hypothetical protein
MLINDASITGSLIVNASASFQNINVAGNIIPDTTNIHNLGSTDKYFKEIYVSTGSINFVDNGTIKTTLTSADGGGIKIGNVLITTSSIAFIDNSGVVTQNIAASSSIGATSNFTPTSSFNAYTQSFSSSVSTSFSSSLASVTSLSSSVSASITSLSSSLTSVNTTQNSRLGSIESITGSYATTGSNTFFGTQTFSGSVYIANDLIVQGSSSIQYISASSVSIGTNIVNLNTANPSVRFAGLTIIDSGSIGGSGSFLYDSVQDEFIFVHRGNGTNVTSSHFVLGPETIDNLGNETYLTNNRLPKGTGKEHLVDSQISDDGSTVSIGGGLTVTGNITGPISATNGVVSGSSQIVYTSLSSIPSGIVSGSTQVRTLLPAGTISGSSQVVSIANSQLTNSTISGKALGTNLDTLTIGTGLSGTSYNGSSAVTIANSGVTSNVAGTGVTVSGATGAVTISIGQSVATSATPSFDQVITTNNGNGTNYRVGDDAWFGDVNAANTVRLKGVQDATAGYLTFGNQATALGLTNSTTLTWGAAFTATGDVTAFSDVRVKENIKTIDNALNKVLCLRGVTFNRIDLDDKSEKMGVIAQEIKEVVPQVVMEENDKLSVAYGNLAGLFIEAIKEQQIKIDNLTIEVENLKKLKEL